MITMSVTALCIMRIVSLRSRSELDHIYMFLGTCDNPPRRDNFTERLSVGIWQNIFLSFGSNLVTFKQMIRARILFLSLPVQNRRVNGCFYMYDKELKSCLRGLSYLLRRDNSPTRVCKRHLFVKFFND